MRTRVKRLIRKLIEPESSSVRNKTQPFFDADYYLETNIDIFIKKLDPYEHFVKYGQFEGRDPARTISADWLQYKYSTISNNPVQFLTDAFKQGRHFSPSPIFDADFYLEQIGTDSDLENLTAYEHYLKFGLDNKLRPNKWLDLDEFSKSNPWYFDAATSEIQKFVNFFDLVRNNQFFGDYVCFTITDLAGNNYQLTEEIVNGILVSKGEFPNNSDKVPISSWLLIDLLQEIADSGFESLSVLPVVKAYPPKIIESILDFDSSENDFENFVFYCHWDNSEQVETWIEKALNEYKQLGFKIIFNTNVKKENLPEFVLRNSSQILIRTNSGHDFESHLLTWYWAQENGLKIDSLLLTNDSIFFPVSSTENIRQELSNAKSNIWALTANTSTKFHIQSFFIVLMNGFANDFMNWVNLELAKWKYISKMGLITRLELQLNSFANQLGIDPSYFFVGLDPMFNSWDKLQEFGVPAIKVNLVRKLISGHPGDTLLLNEKLAMTFPDAKITISEMISYARRLEVSRNPSNYWFNQD